MPAQKGNSMKELIAFFRTFGMQFTFVSVALALITTVCVCLVQLFHCPPLLKRRFARSMRQAGFRNAQGQYPVLIGTKRDRNKKHGIILTVKNMGVSVPDFDRRIDRLQVSLNGIVYCMEYGRKTIYSRLYFLPQKYVRSVIFSPNDNAIGAMSLQNLINLLVIGATGTGKTVAIKILLAKISKFQPNAKIWILDFKQFDFQGFAGLSHYYGYTDCVQGLNDYYEAFKQQQETSESAEPNYLIIDEWGSFIMSLEKKEAELLKGKLAELLMLGRAYQFFPIVGIQRPDASYFSSARDNFQCSKREGHLYIDGIGVEKIRIADITDMGALDAAIQEAMSR